MTEKHASNIRHAIKSKLHSSPLSWAYNGSFSAKKMIYLIRYLTINLDNFIYYFYI